MKSRLFLHGALLGLFYVCWYTLASSPDEFRSTGSWLAPRGLGSYLAGYGFVMAWVWLSHRLWRYRFAVAATVLGLIALLVWWRGGGHSGSILPLLDNGSCAAGLFVGCVIIWCHWNKGQSEQDRANA